MRSIAMKLLAISDVDARRSLYAQLASLLIAFLIGRFLFTSRSAIFLIAFIGAAGAMVANMVVDGQGACFMLVYAPIVYFACVVGRVDGRTR